MGDPVILTVPDYTNKALAGSPVTGSIADILQATEAVLPASTIASATDLSGLASGTELAKIPKSDGAVSWNATALAAIQGEATDALNAYDPPTKTELDSAVSPLALEATLTAIKGSGWSAETLKAIKGAVDGIAASVNAARKGVAFTAVFPIYKTDGTLITGASGLDSEISKDLGTFADCTNEATEIATNSGVYYLTLTATEMNANQVAVIVKTSSSSAVIPTITIYPK